MAPIATSLAMFDMTGPAQASSAQTLPCHGDPVDDVSGDAAAAACFCSPWCAFTTLPSSDVVDDSARAHGVMADHRPAMIRVAAVDPLFKPPRG